MAEDPGSLVYRGREGTGAAYIHGPNVGLGVLAQRQAQKARAEADAAKNRLAQEKYNQQQLETYFNKIDKPDGDLFREQLSKKVNDFQNKTRGIAETNIDISPNRLALTMSNDLERLNGDINRAKELNAIFKQNYALTKSDPTVNADFVNKRQAELAGRDIGNVKRQDAENIMAHPRSFKPGVAILDVVKDIDNQISQTTLGGLKETELGQYKIKTDRGFRFGYYDKNGNAVAGVSDQLIDNVLRQDPRIAQTLRYNAAKADYYKMDVTDPSLESMPDTEDIEEIYHRNYEFKPFSESPTLGNQVKQQVKQQLEMIQSEETKNSIVGMGSKPKGGTEEDKLATDADYKHLRTTIINPLISPIENGKITAKAQAAAKTLTNKVIGNYKINDAGVKVEEGKPFLVLQTTESVMGLKTDKQIKIDLSSPGADDQLFIMLSGDKNLSNKKMNQVDWNKFKESEKAAADPLGLYTPTAPADYLKN